MSGQDNSWLHTIAHNRLMGSWREGLEGAVGSLDIFVSGHGCDDASEQKLASAATIVQASHSSTAEAHAQHFTLRLLSFSIRHTRYVPQDNPDVLEHGKGVSSVPGGHLDILMWSRGYGCPWDPSTCSSAARGWAPGVASVGQREGLRLGLGYMCLQWARVSGCPWSLNSCALAASGGHLAVLKWARRGNGCRWNSEARSQAAEGGHLQLLQWARSRGCPWDHEVCSLGARGGHLGIVQWARENGCPWPPETWRCGRRTFRGTAVGARERL